MPFRIVCFVDDKHLAGSLRALATFHITGLVVEPAVNTDAKFASRMDAAHAILDKMPKDFTVVAMKAELKKIGINDPNYYLQRWKREKRIKLKKRGLWHKGNAA